jgi:hypothetical protein
MAKSTACLPRGDADSELEIPMMRVVTIKAIFPMVFMALRLVWFPVFP